MAIEIFLVLIGNQINMSRVGRCDLGRSIIDRTLQLKPLKIPEPQKRENVLFGFVFYAAFCDINTYCGL